MANEKISSFDDLTTAGITLSQVEGVAAYYDNTGTLTNVRFSGDDLGIESILKVSDTTNAGQEIIFTGDGVIQTGTTTYSAAGIIDNTTGGGFSVTRVNGGDMQFTSNFGNIIFSTPGVGLGFKTQFFNDVIFNSDVYDSGVSAGTAGQVLSSNGVGNGVEWIDQSSGGSSAFTNKAGGATIDWDYATDGPNIKLTMTSGEENALIVSDINEFPDGSSGFLILDPVNTTTYRLPSEDYGSDTGIQSLVTNGDPFTNGSNPVRLQWVYDGTTFWFDIDTNMIEPIYPPTVEFDSTNLIGFWHPRSYPQATIGQVNGSAWPVLPATSATIGDLVPGGIGATFEFYPKTPTTPAYFSFGGTSNRMSKNIAGSVTAAASASFYFQQPADTGDCGLIDFYDGSGIYTECLYLINREFSLYTPSFTFGYPQLIDYTGTGGANLLNDWIFCTVAINNVSNEITLWVGTQASLDAAVAAGGATNWNYDGTLGNTVAVDANGLYKEVASVTISELTWDRIFYGNSAANTESSECHMGMLGIYDVVLNDAAVATNWVDSRGTYFIT